MSCIVALALAAGPCLPVQETAAPVQEVRVQRGGVLGDDAAERLATALADAARAQGLVGLAAAVVQVERAGDSNDFASIDAFYFGHADREADLPVGPESMFRWASISKPVTAVAAVQLAEAGQLDVDRDVREYVTTFPEKPWPITPRQLLCHQGGVVHYRNGEVIRTERDYVEAHPFADVVTALDTFQESPLVAEPGTKYSYTTHGYILLGAVVERAGGAAFHSQVVRRIARPAGMRTFQPDYQWLDIPHRAVGYRRLLGKVVRSTDTDVSWKLPGGGYVSTVEDLARFAGALCTDRLLPREARARMWERQALGDGTRTGYGLGFGIREASDGLPLRIGHTGSQEKTRTLMWVWPDEGRAMVVMTNSEWAQIGRFARDLADAAGLPR